MDERRWRETWPHLDLQKDCSASSDSCWLCDSIQEWNAALNTSFINLWETQPGKICLAIFAVWPSVHENSPHDTAFLAVWLARKHRCIETLELYGRDQPRNVAVPESVAGYASNLQHIFIGGGGSDHWSSILDAIGPINNLESLSLKVFNLSYALAVKLAELLSANANSVRKVYVVWMFDNCTNSDVLMSGISSCQNLTSLECVSSLSVSGLSSPSPESLATLLRSNATLKKFRLQHAPEIEEAFCDFMRTNTTLTELHYKCLHEMRINDVLRAVENDNTLKLLLINCEFLESSHRVVVQGLRSLLSNNSRLSLLQIQHCHICDEFGDQIARGLSENKTLDCLDVSECLVSFEAVQPLFDALTTNNTCSVKFGSMLASTLERETLARALNERNLYGRVQLNWTDYDATGLCALLRLQPPLRPLELELDTDHLSCAPFASLCQALSSSHLVSSLTVHLSRRTTSEHVESLRDALNANVSLKRVILIEEEDEDQGFALRAALGLRFNTSVTHLEIKCGGVDAEDVELLKPLVVENQHLNFVALQLKLSPLDAQGMDILSQGMTENQFITVFDIIGPVENGADQTPFKDALTRNNVRLNCAVRFVLRRNTGKACAEAFELFEAQLSLIERVQTASGMSDRDAEAAVKSAKYFISDNYFIINHVVRDKLECLPGEGTQIDQLDPACWRHIVGYLKVADVTVH